MCYLPGSLLNMFKYQCPNKVWVGALVSIITIHYNHVIRVQVAVIISGNCQISSILVPVSMFMPVDTGELKLQTFMEGRMNHLIMFPVVENLIQSCCKIQLTFKSPIQFPQPVHLGLNFLMNDEGASPMKCALVSNLHVKPCFMCENPSAEFELASRKLSMLGFESATSLAVQAVQAVLTG